MLLLALFALIAGAGTALTPCVLPILPAILGAGVTGGRRRPLGIVVGLALSFTFAAVALVYVIDALGLPNDIARTIAIVVLAGFGLMLIASPLADRVEAWISRIVPTVKPNRGDGFGSGLALGASLGLVYTPCAGPILAGVITVSATQDFTLGRLVIAFSYGIGSAIVLYALMVGGRRFADRLRPVQARFQAAMGVMMIVVAGAIVADLDLRFEEAIADSLPSALISPTERLESSSSISGELTGIRGFDPDEVAEEAGLEEAAAGEKLPILGRAPEFEDTGQWFNTGERELTIEGLREQGKVVLIDFWTYTCINCLRTLPHLRAWDQSYRDEGLTIVGVHTPEFAFEKDASNVAEAIDDHDLSYAVVQDNDFGTWEAWGNRFWPAKYLIDHRGRVRFTHFGEGAYGETEQAIRSLLAEAGEARLGGRTRVSGESIQPGLETPETYLGVARAQGYVEGPVHPGSYDFGTASREQLEDLPLNGVRLEGRWRVDLESAEAGEDAALTMRFGATNVFLVMSAADGPGKVRVFLDGEPLPDRYAGEDVSGAVARIDEQRLYRLVALPQAGRHTLRLEPDPGVAGFAFTFG